MKAITQGKSWWVGTKVKCCVCGYEGVLELGDKPSASDARRVGFDCPDCGLLVVAEPKIETVSTACPESGGREV